MNSSKPPAEASSADWAPLLPAGAQPIYLAIADSIAEDVAAGRLAVGARLPPHRVLAQRLNIDFTTVTRAYAEARRRGLIDARVGRGTFVRDPTLQRRASPQSLVDMTMNSPPPFIQPTLAEQAWGAIDGVGGRKPVGLFLRYPDAMGSAEDRAAGVQWLSPRLPDVSSEKILICPGAQGALLAILSVLAEPGDVICAEALTYPGLRTLAACLRLRLTPIPTDSDGMDPQALEASFRSHKPKGLYINPTIHNPTTAVTSPERRAAIVAVARRHGVPIIEDDPYGFLPSRSPPPIAAMAPDITLHVSSLSKCVSPALRIAYLAAPDAGMAAQIAAAQRATMLMAAPLTTAIATEWVREGIARAVLDEIRAESAARQILAAQILPQGSFQAHPEGFHLWLPLPRPWTRESFTAHMRGLGVGVVASDAFNTAPTAPEAVRIGLGTSSSRADLIKVLGSLRDALGQGLDGTSAT